MRLRLHPIVLAVVLTSCGPKTETKEAAKAPAAPPKPIGAVVEIKAPLGLPPVPVPADNPPTAETIALGRRLYYEKKLSLDDTVACASCHHPNTGFSDGKQFSDGVAGKKGGRNSPTVWNSAYNALQFWDGRSPSLEKQAEGPVGNPVEMAHTTDGAAAKIDKDPAYTPDFQKAFGPGTITYEKIAMSIATFERTVLSGNSPFDKYLYGGDKKALSPAAVRGLAVFRDAKKGNCVVCHTIEDKFALFTDNKFHNLGRFTETKVETDRGAFKTPTLRNIAQTGPYMHDGSLKTLKDVIDFYVGGGNSNPHLDKEVKALDFLTKQERADLVTFLESLTGETPANIGPPEGVK